MTTPPPAWQDPEQATIAWLSTTLDTPRVWAGGEPTAGTALPYITVERVGGAGTRIDRDVDIEVTVYAATRAAMWAMATDVEEAMRALAASGPDGSRYVDDVAEAFGFRFDPFPNQSVRRATSTWTLTVRPWA